MLFFACPYLGFVAGMGYIRQGAAIGFSMAALAALHERKMGRFWGLLILATSFHYSAVVFLVIMWASTWKRFVIAAAMATPVLWFLRDTSTAGRLAAYAEGELNTASGVYFRLLILGFGVIFVWVQRRRWAMLPEETAFLSRAAILYFFALVLALPESAIVDRFALYLFPGYLLGLGRSIEFTSQPRRWLITGIVFAHSYAVVIFWFSTSLYARYLWTPYRIAFN